MTAEWESPFSQDILALLGESLNHERIVTFSSGPQRGIKYLEGHDVIVAANRIFGYGNWGYRLVGQPWVLEDGTQGQNGTPYQVWAAAVELTITGCHPILELGTNTRQGAGSASLEMAIKGAVTDGMKRCLKNFGDQFGLVLYDKDNEYWDAPDDHRTNTAPPPETPRQRPQGASQSAPVELSPTGMIEVELRQRHITLSAVERVMGYAPENAEDAREWWTNNAATRLATMATEAEVPEPAMARDIIARAKRPAE